MKFRKHLVSCYYCQLEFDERDSIGETPSDGGSVCRDCLDAWWRDLVNEWLAIWLTLEVYQPDERQELENQLAWLEQRADNSDVRRVLEIAAQYIKEYAPVFKGGFVNLTFEKKEKNDATLPDQDLSGVERNTS